ncbi:MAG TPA: DUF2127 domain-containing protein [Anaerolineales bacterium]|nr:DUF2127 domain-containing protein [Anaerolineales bacterium]
MKAESALNQPSFTRLLHRVLELGIILKGFDAILEMIGGILFWFASNVTFDQWITALTQHELVEDPQDKVALLLREVAAPISSDARLFGSAYLIVHGLAKLWLVTGLLRGKAWAYPATFGFLSLFIIYQVYRLSYSFSIGLLALTFFDSVFAFLIWREYLSSKNA